jgi:hypothetical protein
LGHALLAHAAVSNDAAVLAEAAVSFRQSAEAQDAGFRATDGARAREGLGTALWAFGVLRSDLASLSEAARAKLAALDHYEASGLDAEAARVRRDLAALETVIQAHASRGPADAAA